MKVASHQLEYGLYSYGVCEGVLLNFIISTDDKLSCIYINILNKGGYFHGNLQYAFEIFRLSEIRWFHMGTNVWWKTTKSRTS